MPIFDGMAKATTRSAGWYPDERTPWQLRWWDGTEWTENVKRAPGYLPAGVRSAQRPVVAPPDEPPRPARRLRPPPSRKSAICGRVDRR